MEYPVDYQTVVAFLIVASAAVYAGKKAWDLLKPGTRSGGCGCSGDTKSGCGECPLVKP